MKSSTKEISINEAESTFILNKLADGYNQDTCHDDSDLKNGNHKVQLDLSSQLQVYHNAGEATAGPIPLQKNEAYGLVLENIQATSSDAELVSQPVTSQMATVTSDLHTSDIASNNEQTSTNNGPQLHTAELIDLCTCTTTEETVNSTHDNESDSEHQSYEKVCTYEKVQPCNVAHLLVQLSEERHRLEPLLHGEVSSNDDRMDTTDSDRETARVSPNESLDSYEQVWGYERIHHCDFPLEELAQKDDNTASTIAKTDDN